MNRPSCMEKSTLQHLLYLADHMRYEERAQYEKTFAKPYNAKECAMFCWKLPGPKFTVIDHVPLAAGGCAYEGAGTFELWMVGSSEGWDRKWRSLTKAARWLIDAVFEAGGRKVI